jgi:cation/acetate symporter
VIVGALMILYVTVGGMRGTTWVQMIKAGLLMAGAILMSLFVLAKFNFNPSTLLGEAASQSGKGDAFLNPGLRYGAATGRPRSTSSASASRWCSARPACRTSSCASTRCRRPGTPAARSTGRSASSAPFYLLTLALGFGAAALVGTSAIRAANPAATPAAPQLAEELGGGPGTTGGAFFLAFIASVAFATILAVVAGLTLASSSSVAHDIYANVDPQG